MDRFVQLVRKVFRVPDALVSLVAANGQAVAGASDHDQPASSARQTPLSQSLCQQVITSAQLLAIVDTRLDPRTRDRAAADDRSVLAYLGAPLLDGDHNVLGALCAIDHTARVWTDEETAILVDLAAACSAELRHSIAVAASNRGLASAETAARVRDVSESRLAELAADVNRALANSQLLLAASEALTHTTTVDDVLDVISGLVSGAIKPANVHLALLGHDRVITVHGTEGLPADVVERWSTLDEQSPSPSAAVIQSRRPLFISNTDELVDRFPGVAEAMDRLQWCAIASAPLGPDEPLGALTLAWAEEHHFDVGERAVIVALAGYVGHAIARATRLAHRTAAAEILQRALLTPLPRVAGYTLAARYRPAQRGDQVGGDWYDAFTTGDGSLLLAVGDVAGHDIRAAAQMSELRSMLRAVALMPDHSPAGILSRLEKTSLQLGAHTIATSVVARVERDEGGGTSFVWSNAGHMPVIFIDADGTVTADERHDRLLGLQTPADRSDHQRMLRPGDTVLLFTDGLVEVRDRPLNEPLAGLRDRIVALRGAGTEQLLDILIAELSPDAHEDDVAMLALTLSH